ncbi:hypothetical protein HJB89_25380 [Rhizobium sp. NZLR8]|uniref:hypothetical protein n=1 Tax=Rhizobium sp. NZLR8 TaxID=2731104 RepID=UPI001C82AB73|nr:hypothetical protein [Rhizobium sp. NZLR8]MBX5160420.1 hypothetical protein [Rhizobium sp. NZLR8]
MAKLTKKVRIVGYDVFKNEFQISFKLAGYADHLGFVSTYTYPGKYGFAGNGEEDLDLLGFHADDIQQIIQEIFDWVEKPRKSLGGSAHSYMMHSRFDMTTCLEAERRGRAEASRIAVEAPCLDWAMSISEEIEREDAAAKAGEKLKEFRDAGGRWTAPERGDIDPMKAVDLEAAGLGEESSRWDVSIEGKVNEELSTSLGSFMALHADDTYFDTEPKAVDLEAQLIEFELAVMAYVRSFNTSDEREAIQTVNQARQTILNRDAQRPKIVPLNRSQQSQAVDEAQYQARRRITDDATDKAVNTIHTHARRFLTPMSLREHDFLRAIIQEEIEKVVGGVL